MYIIIIIIIIISSSSSSSNGSISSSMGSSSSSSICRGVTCSLYQCTTIHNTKKYVFMYCIVFIQNTKSLTGTNTQ